MFTHPPHNNDSQVGNDSSVPGSSVAEALDNLYGGTKVASGSMLTSLVVDDGGVVFVQTFRDFFQYRAAATSSVDNTSTISGSAGIGRWERLGIPHPSWSKQTPIYIDPVDGNDENDATTSGSSGGFVGPIKTNVELVRRLGQVYAPIIAQTVFVLPGDPGPLVWTVATMSPAASGIIHYRGTLVAQTTATISAVTHSAAATNTDGSFHGSAGWTTSTEINRVLIENSGLNAWVIEQGGGTSGGIDDAIVSTWTSDVVSTPNQTSPGSQQTANGRIVTSYTHATTLSNVALTFGGNYFAFSDINFSGGTTRLFSQGASMFLNRCVIGDTAHTFRCSGGNIYRNNCRYGTAMGSSIDGNDNYTRTFCNAGVSKVAWTTGATTPSGITLRNNIIFSGVGYGVIAQGARLFLDGVCFRKITTGNIITFVGGSSARVTAPMWGGGHTTSGVIFALDRACHMQVTTAQVVNMTIATSGSNISIAGITSSYVFDATGSAQAVRNFSFSLLTGSIDAGGWNGSMTNPTVVGSVCIQ